jgi:hypothetical protein
VQIIEAGCGPYGEFGSRPTVQAVKRIHPRHVSGASHAVIRPARARAEDPVPFVFIPERSRRPVPSRAAPPGRSASPYPGGRSPCPHAPPTSSSRKIDDDRCWRCYWRPLFPGPRRDAHTQMHYACGRGAGGVACASGVRARRLATLRPFRGLLRGRTGRHRNII